MNDSEIQLHVCILLASERGSERNMDSGRPMIAVDLLKQQESHPTNEAVN